MSSKEKYEAKVIRALSQTLANEDGHLRKYYWLGKGAAFAGGVLVGLTVLMAFQQTGSTFGWIVAMSSLGGLLIGLSIYFDTSVKQWPVVKRFLNTQAIHDAAKQ